MRARSGDALAKRRRTRHARVRIFYIASIPVAFVVPWLSGVIFVAVASLWFAPNRRIERGVTYVPKDEHGASGS